MKTSQYAPFYKTGYAPHSKTQLKTFSNENSSDSNNFTVSSFAKVGYPFTLPKQFENDALLYKTPVSSSNQSN